MHIYATDDTRSQGISSHGINPAARKYSGLSTRGAILSTGDRESGRLNHLHQQQPNPRLHIPEWSKLIYTAWLNMTWPYIYRNIYILAM